MAIMKTEEKQLLTKDLCARLPYGLLCEVEFKDGEGWKKLNMSLEGVFTDNCYFESKAGSIYSKEFKPYLRPMSSMTGKEKEEYVNTCLFFGNGHIHTLKTFDFFNSHHFDFRGLIEKGLALKAPKDMYKEE